MKRKILSTPRTYTLLAAACLSLSLGWAQAQQPYPKSDPMGKVIEGLQALPPYQHELSPDDPRLAKYRHQDLNILEFGAVGDGKSHPLKEKYATQEEIDQKFGPGRYRLDDEQDYVGLMEAIRLARELGQVDPPSGLVEYVAKVVIPTGIYEINRMVPLVNTFGLAIVGAGRKQAILRFNEAEPLFGIARSGFLTFSHFSIESRVGKNSTAFLIDGGHIEDPRVAGRPAFNFIFEELIFQWLHTGIRVTGTFMTDSVFVEKCRFVQCLRAVNIQNPQSLSWQFVGCNFESAANDTTYAPYKPEDVVTFDIEAGGSITVLGGNIIHAGTTLRLAPNPNFSPDHGTSSSITFSNGTYNFYGVKWEQDGERPVLFDVVDDGRYQARINIDNCNVYQRAAALGGTLGKMYSGLNVTIRNTFIRDGAVIEDWSTSKSPDRQSVLILDNTSPIKVDTKGAGPLPALVEIRGPQKR